MSGPDAALAVELASASEMAVYRVEADAASVERARKLAADRNLSPLRLRVERGPLGALAYPDYCASVVLVDSLDGAGIAAEVWRVLRPGGRLYVRQPIAAVQATLKAAGLTSGFKTADGPGGLTKVSRSPLEGAGNWTHYHYDPSNNRYSPDEHIRPPFRVLWYGDPDRSLGRLWLSQGLSADGRVFLADLDPQEVIKEVAPEKKRSRAVPDPTIPRRAYLTARDAYTGIVLWERAAGGPRLAWERGTKLDFRNGFFDATNLGGKVLAGQMAIGGDKLFLADSARCLVMDAATGKDVMSLTAPPPCHPENHWLYLAHLGETLIGYAAPPDDPAKPPRPGTDSVSGKGGPAALFALNAGSGQPRWIRGGKADPEMGDKFSPPLAVGAERVFVRSGDDLYAVDVTSGKTAWVKRGLQAKGDESYWEGTIHAGKFYLYRFNMRIYGTKRSLPTLVLRASDGKELEEEMVNGKPLYLSSAQKLNRLPSGVPYPSGTASVFGCAYDTCAGQVIFGRNGYVMEGKTNVIGYGGFRAACKVGAIPANGLVHILPNWGCKCRPFNATITMQPGKGDEAIDRKAPAVVEAGAKLAASGAVPAAAGDWPTFRANAARTAVTPQDLTAPRKQTWQIKLDGEPTPPIAVADTVYFGSTDERLHALDAVTGRTRWTYHATGPIRAAPVCWNGRIYFGADDGWVYCLSSVDGNLLWRLRAAPSARKQTACGRVVSAWPVRQGLAVDAGTVYFTAGQVPSQGILTGAAEAVTGRVLWRIEPSRWLVPCASLVLSEDRLFIPGEMNAPSLQFARADGKSIKSSAGGSYSYFAEMSYVTGSAADGEARRKGFLVHGSGGNSRGAGADFTANKRPFYMTPVPWDGRRLPSQFVDPALGEGSAILPIFGKTQVYLLHGGGLAAIERARADEFAAVRDLKRRDGFIKWRASDLPCGRPEWLVFAGMAEDDGKATLLAGGPKGSCALDASSGKVRWHVAQSESTFSPAIARGRVFLTSANGTIRCLAGH